MLSLPTQSTCPEPLFTTLSTTPPSDSQFRVPPQADLLSVQRHVWSLHPLPKLESQTCSLSHMTINFATPHQKGGGPDFFNEETEAREDRKSAQGHSRKAGNLLECFNAPSFRTSKSSSKEGAVNLLVHMGKLRLREEQ